MPLFVHPRQKKRPIDGNRPKDRHSLQYLYKKGLPVAPIGNPGLDAILAAIEPKDSPYLFYLSDNNGEMHYAKNFDGHKINKVKYLR